MRVPQPGLRLALASAVLCTAARSGPARQQTTPQPDGAAMIAVSEAAPSFHAGPLEPATAPLSQDAIVRAVGSRAMYEVLAGSRAGARIEQRVEAAAGNGDGTALAISERVRRKGRGAWEAGETLRVVRAASGMLSLREVETPDEDSRSIFEDGLAFAAPTLAPDAALEGASPMKVVRLGSGAARGSGSATRSLRLVGESTVRVCGEEMRASVLDLAFEARLDVATARVRARIYAVPGRGIVAEERSEKVVVLGIFPRTSDETVVLLPENRAP